MDEKEFARLEALYNLAVNNTDINEIRNASVLLVKLLKRHNLISTIRNSIYNNNYTSYSNPSSQTRSSTQDDQPNKTQPSNTKFKYLSFVHLAEAYKSKTVLSKANYTIDYIIKFLNEKYIASGSKHLLVSVPIIIDLALKDKLIDNTEIYLYTKYIRQYLQDEVKRGALIGVRGRSGGFKLK